MSRDAFEIAESIAAGQPPDSVALEWLASGLRKWGRGVPLEAALGLNHAGRKRQRNVELRAAAEAICAGRDMSDNDLAGELAARLQRFTVDKLPRYWRTGDVSGFDAVEHRLLAAVLTGAPPTSSKKNLYRIIEREPGQETASLVQADG
ncbi:MAG: hypothetical protein Q8N48_00175 [Thiobacillus sp.]|nr:hypothetical protein [Thiobacillus sp.]MDP2977227.1 hypothetical protein [Thiobacillus sp.]